MLPEEEYIESWITSRAIDFLERHTDSQPFFLWIGFCGPHGPLDPPRRYAEMYPIEEMPLPKTYLADLSDRPEFLRRRRNRRFTGEDTTLIRRCIAHYYALITLIDDQIGRIWRRLEELGLMGNTILIFTSDHGDMMGDFGMMGKANFYEPVIRVPTVLVLPPRFKQTISRFDGLVETMSLAPTVLGYAGIERPPEMTANSWRPIVEDGVGGETAILCEYVSNDRKLKGKCVRTERYKFVSWGRGVGELYDLQEDPLELRNLYDDPKYLPLRDEMRDILLDRLAESEMPPYTQWLEKLPEHVLRT